MQCLITLQTDDSESLPCADWDYACIIFYMKKKDLIIRGRKESKRRKMCDSSCFICVAKNEQLFIFKKSKIFSFLLYFLSFNSLNEFQWINLYSNLTYCSSFFLLSSLKASPSLSLIDFRAFSFSAFRHHRNLKIDTKIFNPEFIRISRTFQSQIPSTNLRSHNKNATRQWILIFEFYPSNFFF